MRQIAFIDAESGTLFSYGGRQPYLLRVSEVVDRSQLTGAVRRCKARVGKQFLGHRTLHQPPRIRLGNLPGSVCYRRKTAMRIVFKWLGSLEGQPVPELEVEEGYTEGIV